MTSPERYVLVMASTRAGRIGPTVTRWFLDQLDPLPPDVVIDVLDLKQRARHPDPATSALLDRADGIVIVTPEYNHSFPGPLKEFLDGYRDEWRFKPATFVSYGAMSGGIRAVEHLRTVMAELYVVTTRNGVVVHHPWKHLVDGVLDLSAPDDDRSRAETARASARGALAELRWWAQALRTARRDLGTEGRIESEEVA